VNLWIGPQISNTLDVDNDQLVSRALKREMTERLQRFNVHC